MEVKIQPAEIEKNKRPVYCENIRTMRFARGLTQKDVAKVLGISRATYARIEEGNIALTVDRLLEIAEVLEANVYTLLGKSPQFTHTLMEESLLADYNDCDERGRRIIELTARAERMYKIKQSKISASCKMGMQNMDSVTKAEEKSRQ